MKKIVMTGVTRGLGRALAAEFARRGHTVWGCGRNQSQLEQLAKELSSSGEAGHRFDQVDVLDAGAVESWAREITADGAPDLLINNAGVLCERAPLWQISRADFDRVIDVNVKGVANVLRSVLPGMIQRGRGVVLNFSSGWGQSTAPLVAPYCASKFAIEGLTKALAQELPPGMAAIPLSPGIIRTEMLETAFGADAEQYWTPAQWVEVAAPFILGIGPDDNGRSMRIPGS